MIDKITMNKLLNYIKYYYDLKLPSKNIWG